MQLNNREKENFTTSQCGSSVVSYQYFMQPHVFLQLPNDSERIQTIEKENSIVYGETHQGFYKTVFQQQMYCTYPRCLPILGDFSRGDRWAGTESPGRIPSMQKGSLQPLESLASSLSASTTIKLSTTIGGQKKAKLMRNQNCQDCMIFLLLTCCYTISKKSLNFRLFLEQLPFLL